MIVSFIAIPECTAKGSVWGGNSSEMADKSREMQICNIVTIFTLIYSPKPFFWGLAKVLILDLANINERMRCLEGNTFCYL